MLLKNLVWVIEFHDTYSAFSVKWNADRGEVQKGSAEIFFRKVKFWKEDGDGDAPPIFVGILPVNFP